MIEQIHFGNQAAEPTVARVDHRHLRDAVLFEQRNDLAQRRALLRRNDWSRCPGSQDVADQAEVIFGLQEALVAHPVVVKDLRQVLLRAVGQQHQDVLRCVAIAIELLGITNGASDGSTAATATHDAFLANQCAGQLEALFVVDAHDLVDVVQVHGRR